MATWQLRSGATTFADRMPRARRRRRRTCASPDSTPSGGSLGCGFLAPLRGARDDFFMRIRERRRRRSIDPCLALTYQLAACCKDGSIDAMVVADGDGLPL